LSGNPWHGRRISCTTLDNDRAILKISRTAYLAAGIDKVLKANMLHYNQYYWIMISVHFDATPVVDFKTAANGDNDKNSSTDCCRKEFIAPSAYEVVYY
jgi:glutamate-1-semialdehyde 2,1-aminomutase